MESAFLGHDITVFHSSSAKNGHLKKIPHLHDTAERRVQYVGKEIQPVLQMGPAVSTVRTDEALGQHVDVVYRIQRILRVLQSFRFLGWEEDILQSRNPSEEHSVAVLTVMEDSASWQDARPVGSPCGKHARL